MVCNDDELIEIHLRRSRLMFMVGTIVHTLALISPWLSGLSLILQLLASLLVMLHGIWFYRLFIAQNSPASVLALRYRNDQWLLLTAAGWQRVWVQGTLLVTPWLMALQFRDDTRNKLWQRNYLVCLWSDTDDAAPLHALRLRLLLQKQQGTRRR